MVLTRKVELENYRKAVTYGTCWTDDTKCNECTSLPMCNLVNKLLDEIEQLEADAAAMREALELILRKHTDIPNHNNYPSSTSICRRALSSDAGRPILEERDRLQQENEQLKEFCKDTKWYLANKHLLDKKTQQLQAALDKAREALMHIYYDAADFSMEKQEQLMHDALAEIDKSGGGQG